MIVRTTAEGAVSGGVGATCVDDAVDCAAKADEAEGENVDLLELGAYVAKESIEDVKTGPNLTDDQRNEFMDLAKQFANLFTEAPVLSLLKDVLCVGPCFCRVIHSQLKPLRAQRTLEQIT